MKSLKETKIWKAHKYYNVCKYLPLKMYYDKLHLRIYFEIYLSYLLKVKISQTYEYNFTSTIIHSTLSTLKDISILNINSIKQFYKIYILTTNEFFFSFYIWLYLNQIAYCDSVLPYFLIQIINVIKSSQWSYINMYLFYLYYIKKLNFLQNYVKVGRRFILQSTY